jgi:hypothetical protein
MADEKKKIWRIWYIITDFVVYGDDVTWIYCLSTLNSELILYPAV